MNRESGDDDTEILGTEAPAPAEEEDGQVTEEARELASWG